MLLTSQIQLPRELWLDICSFLSPWDHGNVLCVNKFLMSLSSDLFRQEFPDLSRRLEEELRERELPQDVTVQEIWRRFHEVVRESQIVIPACRRLGLESMFVMGIHEPGKLIEKALDKIERHRNRAIQRVAFARFPKISSSSNIPIEHQKKIHCLEVTEQMRRIQGVARVYLWGANDLAKYFAPCRRYGIRNFGERESEPDEDIY